MGNTKSMPPRVSSDRPGAAGYLTGGLGNQLFVIATTYAYCLENNLRFFVSKDWKGISKSRPSYWDTLLTNITSFVNEEQINSSKSYFESGFNYKKIPSYNNNIVLRGYFQSPKYFEKYEKEIKELLALPENLKTYSKEKLSKFENQTLVAVHIRHGDYKKHPKVHVIQPIEYYTSSQKYIEEKLGYRPTYLYFSDDKEWVHKNMKLQKNDTIIECEKDYQEFAVMQQCHHFIIANSSFSWWAAWLSNTITDIKNTSNTNDKIVIAPQNWFGPKFKHSWYDIYDKRFLINDGVKIKNVNDYQNTFFLGLITCKVYEEKRRKQDLSKCSIEYRYFIGDKNLIPYDEAIEDIENKIVYLPCSDSYEALPQKVYQMIKWIYKNRPKIEYIIKSDDDVIFNFNFLNPVCNKIYYEEIDYAGYKVEVKKEYMGTCHLGKCEDKVLGSIKVKVPKCSYCAGPCYFISKNSGQIILENLFKNNTIYEDQSIGHCLNLYNIQPYHLKIQNSLCFWK